MICRSVSGPYYIYRAAREYVTPETDIVNVDYSRKQYSMCADQFSITLI